MRMGLASQQLLWALSDPLRHPRPDKTTVVTEELQQAEIGVAEALAQKKVIA